jgi:hypothetical protein
VSKLLLNGIIIMIEEKSKDIGLVCDHCCNIHKLPVVGICKSVYCDHYR